MAYTLKDMADLATDPVRAAVIDVLRMESPIMERLSFEDEGRLDLEILKMKTLPTIGSRKIGGSFSESKGIIEPVKERIINFGSYIDIDKALMKAKTIVDQKSLQITMFTKAMGAYFNNVFVNGTPTADYDSLTGIWWRLVNDSPATQSINGASIDISPDSASIAANKILIVDYLHQLCDVTGRPDGPDILLMGRTCRMRLESMLRQSGMLSTTTDSYGRKFATFGEGGPAIVEAGTTNPLDLTSQVIGDVENVNGAALSGGTGTSIYAIKFGGEYLNGWQEYGLDVNEVGWLENGLTYRVVVDWTPGIYMVSPFSLGRIYGIVAA